MEKNIENKNMEDNTMTNDLYELDAMRRQISLLKEKLDNESIINDKLMRNVMKTKVGKVDSYLLKMLFITPLVMALMYLDFAIMFPISTACLVATEIMLVCCGIFIYCNKRLLASADLASGNLVEECRKLVRFKKREIRYLYVSIPLVLAWMAWLSYELLHYGNDPTERLALVYGCVFGGIVGFCIGLYKFRSMMRNINEVVRQIEEIS